jgi:hypothetical protein
MPQLIGKCFDNGVMILAGLFLLRCYFKPEAKQLYQKKWVPFACGFLILYNVVELGLSYHKYSNDRIPSKAELVNDIRGNHTLAEADVLYRSPHGYSILIPKGYSYTTFASGPMSLVAIKNKSDIAVAEEASAEPLDKAVEEISFYLTRKNATYSFSTPESFQPGRIPGICLEIQVTKNDNLVKGLLFLFKSDGQVFQVMCSCPAAVFEENKGQFESIIASLSPD